MLTATTAVASPVVGTIESGPRPWQAGQIERRCGDFALRSTTTHQVMVRPSGGVISAPALTGGKTE